MSSRVRRETGISLFLEGLGCGGGRDNPHRRAAEETARAHGSYSSVESALLHRAKFNELWVAEMAADWRRYPRPGAPPTYQPDNRPHEYRVLAERAAQTAGISFMTEGFRVLESRWVSEMLPLLKEESRAPCCEVLALYGFQATPPVIVPPLPAKFAIPEVPVEIIRKKPIQVPELVPDDQPLTPTQENFLYSYLEMNLIWANGSWQPYTASHPLPAEHSIAYNEARRNAIAEEQKKQKDSGGTDELIARHIIADNVGVSIPKHQRYVVTALAKLLIERAEPDTALRVLSESDRLDWSQYEVYTMLELLQFLTWETAVKEYTRGRLRTTAEDRRLQGYIGALQTRSETLRDMELAKARVTLAHAVAQQFAPAHERASKRLNDLSARFPQNGAWPVISQVLADTHKDHACIDAWVMARHQTRREIPASNSPGLLPIPASTIWDACRVTGTPSMMDLCGDFCIDVIDSIEELLKRGNGWQPQNAEQTYETIYNNQYFVNNLVDNLMNILIPILTSPLGRQCAWEYVHSRIPEVFRERDGHWEHLRKTDDIAVAPRISEQILKHAETLLNANAQKRAEANRSLATGLLHAIRVGEILAPENTPEEECYITFKRYHPITPIKVTSLSHFLAKRLDRAPKAAERIGRRIHESLTGTRALADYLAFVNEQVRGP